MATRQQWETFTRAFIFRRSIANANFTIVPTNNATLNFFITIIIVMSFVLCVYVCRYSCCTFYSPALPSNRRRRRILLVTVLVHLMVSLRFDMYNHTVCNEYLSTDIKCKVKTMVLQMPAKAKWNNG